MRKKDQWLILQFLWIFTSISLGSCNPATVCIVGSGVGGSSVAYFLRVFNPSTPLKILMFEKKSQVGGRMAAVTLSGETFEAGASILHPKNYHASNFTRMLNLHRKDPPSSESDLSLGIWNGKHFLFKTITLDFKIPFARKITDFVNQAYLFFRYGFSLLRMQQFVEDKVNRFLKYYQPHDSRPVFETVTDMLEWADLNNLTTRTLHEELIGIGVSPLLIEELITVITRINYGQSSEISGLAGAISLAGSSNGLWAVEGGNWQMARGLISASDVELHVEEEINSISCEGEQYELKSAGGKRYVCDVAVVASPMDEQNIVFSPAITLPKRKMQHTHATFVRGLINPEYFGLKSVTEVPKLVGTIEDASLPFSSVSVLKENGEDDVFYKVFSREEMMDSVLDLIFKERKETVRINWAAYPQYHAPEVYAPFVLDNRHIYYVNAFENAASTIEVSAVAAENIARLLASRFLGASASCSRGHPQVVTHSEL